jgi:ABC-type sugar transport system permease subunit
VHCHISPPWYVHAKLTLLQKYQWGFSFVQLLVMNIMLLVWIIGILLMWAVARATLQQRNRSNIAGEYKATVELAASMRKELSEEPDELLVLSEEEIKERIRGVDGGNISYNTSVLERPMSVKEKVKAWCRRELWWLCSLLVLVIAVSCVWALLLTRTLRRRVNNLVLNLVVVVAYMASGCVYGLVFSLAFGSTWRSRGLFTLFWVAMSVALLFILTYW